jgi:23S rRNA (cytosine1962-C5)-methyltransferase
VVHKPPGWNTHAPDPHAGEGIYDWLRHREPRWAGLALVHRLDKATSGVLLFGKSRRANRSLTEQFTRRRIRKRYRLLTAAEGPREACRVRLPLVREGARYRPAPPGAAPAAETRFLPGGREGRWRVVFAEPRTGRTHQIRAHAAAAGFPVLGDTLYGGAPFARVCLHAERLELYHPATGERMAFHVPADFRRPPGEALRAAFLDPDRTDAFRLAHGAADGFPGWFVERLGDWLLAQSEAEPTPEQIAQLAAWREEWGLRGACHKHRDRRPREQRPETAAPRPLLGDAPEGPFAARENGLTWELAFARGCSCGLFLDQRDNRRRLLTRHVAAGFPPFPPGDWRALNLFAYTCGFSLAAARGGARVTSVDLSRRYLDWGRRNFARNGLPADAHEFLVGDAFEWLRRLGRRERRFAVVVLDPPTFSTSKRGGRFRAEKDYGKLVAAAARVLAPGGFLLASTNAGALRPAAFVALVETALATAGRRVTARHYAPQPPDFPVTRGQPAHLKTLWLAVE